MKPTTRKQNVEVAKDVLRLMRKMNVTESTYLEFKGEQPDIEETVPWCPNVTMYCGDAARLQKNIPKIAEHCEVCAKGAMFLAYVHLYDGIDRLPNNDEVANKTKEIFGAQGHFIEIAFECWGESRVRLSHDWKFCNINQKKIVAACKFGKQFEDSRRRLRAIMQNIIIHNGMFCPRDLKNKGSK